MNLQQLTTFCTVLSEGSMTAAAEKLLLTQPAVSQQVKALEDELGVPLLLRGLRQVKSTTQGQLLYDYAKRILYLTQQAETAIHTISQDISGSLSMGTINSIGMYLISPIIGLFLKHNPKLSIRLTYGSYRSIIHKMKEGELDLAILPDMESQFGMKVNTFKKRLLAKDEMWLVATGKDSSLPTSINVKTFASSPVVIYSDMYPGFKDILESSLKKHGSLVPVFETDNVGTLKRVVESGLGWGFLPSHSIKKQVRTRRLTHIQCDELRFSVDINLYTRETEHCQKMSEIFFRAMQPQILGSPL